MIVVNQAPTARDGVEPPSVKRALRALEVMRLPVVPTLLRSRAIYQSALETGKSVEECYDVNAAREIAALWAFIERFTFGKRDTPPPPDAAEDEDLKFAP
jgi:chromosome partitioning protein